MENMTYCLARYLDTSAAVKLVVSEAASDVVRKYVERGGPFYITSVCVAEALSVLKVKYLYRNELTQDQYLAKADGLMSYLRDRTIHVEDVPLEDIQVFSITEQLARQHGIDLADALQLYTLKHGRFSQFVGHSKSLLVTADEELAKAARIEGLDVWDCVHEEMPAS